MAEEIWKDIPGYEGRYQVSDQGRVRNASGFHLRPNRMTHGYYCAHLYNGIGKRGRRVFTLHRLVAQVFVPNDGGLPEVNHKNFDRADNSARNLEWVSRAGNVQHAVAARRRASPAKQVMGVHIQTGRVVRFSSQIAAELCLRGKQTGGISGAMKRRRPAYGYVWCFA